MSGAYRKRTGVITNPAGAVRHRFFLKLALIPLSVWILDRISKIYISQNFELGQSFRPVADLPVYITYHLNTGIAFGMLTQQAAVILVMNCVIIGFVTVFYIQSARNSFCGSEALGAGMMLGGALGNLFDRVYFRAVIDFIDLRFWPIFNLADSFICLGAFMIIVYSFYKLSGSRVRKTS